MANMSETDKTRIIHYFPDLSFEKRFYVKTDWRDYAEKMLEQECNLGRALKVQFLLWTGLETGYSFSF